MLTTLRIKNLAVVSDLALELEPGYNVITGETGAGKSVLIGALNLVLGERADRTLIRSGADSCLVEAVFDIGRLRVPLAIFLAANGLEPCEQNQLVLKRTFAANGANRQFVNGSPATLNALAAIGEWLVDIHGPHEHQSLLQPSKQLAILDAFGGLTKQREKFSEIVRRRSAIEAEKTLLVVDDKTYAQQVEMLRYQAEEITAARLRPNEEMEVEGEFKRASSTARLVELSQLALSILSENENAMMTQAGALGRVLQELHRLDPSVGDLVAQHELAVQTQRDLISGLSRYADKVETDPARLKELEERLNLIHSLKRKYGFTLDEVIAFGEQARQRLESLLQRDSEINRLNVELLKVSAELRRAGEELSAHRHKVIPRLGKAVSRQLKDLGFKQSHFEVAITTRVDTSVRETAEAPAGQGADKPVQVMPRLAAAQTGFDAVEFQFSPNPGEPLRPLRSIASSGEMARVMLALKTVLAEQDEIPVLVFDEVDANVGGETAASVGEKMAEIARHRQVICITHLPAVAACASAHHVVTKQVKGGRTQADIQPLKGFERVNEIARMLGGQSDAAHKLARSMLEERGQME